MKNDRTSTIKQKSSPDGHRVWHRCGSGSFISQHSRTSKSTKVTRKTVMRVIANGKVKLVQTVQSLEVTTQDTEEEKFQELFKSERSDAFFAKMIEEINEEAAKGELLDMDELMAESDEL